MKGLTIVLLLAIGAFAVHEHSMLNMKNSPRFLQTQLQLNKPDEDTIEQMEEDQEETNEVDNFIRQM